MIVRNSPLLVVLIALLVPAFGQDTPPVAAPSATEKLELARQKHESARETQDATVLQEAAALVQEVLAADPLNTEARLLAGEILMDANDYNGARDNFKAVLDIEPRNFRANLGYAKVLGANQAWRQATYFLETAEELATAPERVAEVKRLLAFAYYYRGDLTKAMDKVTESLRAKPDDPDALLTAVEIRLSVASRDPRFLLGEDGALPSAERYLNDVKGKVQEKPWDRLELTRLSRAYDLLLSALGELHNSYYRRNAKNEPTDELQSGKEVDAAAALNRIAQTRSEQALVRLTLAEHETLMVAEKAVEYDPRNLTYLDNLLALCQRLKHQTKAIETCRKILAIDPQHAAARAYLESVGEPLDAPSGGE